MKTFLACCLVALALPAHAAPNKWKPTPGDVCQLEKPLPLSEKPGGKGKKTKAPKGTALTIVGAQKNLLQLEGVLKSGKAVEGFAPVGAVASHCVKQKPAEEVVVQATPATPEPVAEIAVATEPVVPPDLPASLPVADIPPVPVANAVAPKVETTRVAVLALRGAEDAELVRSLTALIPETLQRLGRFVAITDQEIQQMLQMEALKQSLGCDDASCLAELGGAIGADFMITGSLTRVGEAFLLQLQLMNIREGKVAQRLSRDYKGSAAGLPDEMRAATKYLMRDLLAQASGTLAVNVSEEGATVRIDDSIVGVSPLSVQTLSGGMHTLAIEKEGFVVFRQDVEVLAKQQTTVAAQLLPSEDFRKAYVNSASRTRLLAWTSLGVGVAAAGGAVGLFVWSGSEANALRADVVRYNALADAERTGEQQKQLNKRRGDLATVDLLIVTSAGVGLGAMALGAILLATGDDPDRFISVDASNQASTQLLLGPTSVGLLRRF